ncbi:MAG: 50S ribosomal protein L24 [Gammaproteobacteria bacterium]|nr:50S ribosomal protein L24 [Gammaproteobacteria bacterium]MDE0478956.1 50S ribosomal protein L24 [Gammaproteobacteria bacterium]MDE0509659.1 50S ribosomal protein L24 [Gammaproteobacteria bacterium]MXX05325.1 50S ribosomal protein L24 [Gammaproteobacteria bacterium]MXY91302.1 50S ribosomal protein L24 [Gammaproteobacteria bacterium]
MRKLRRDDEVIVIAGRDKGTRGTITRMMGDDKVIVAGVNMIKRHTRPNPNLGQPGGIVEKEAPLHISNVAIFNPDTGAADRVGIRVDDEGGKTRFFKSSGEDID